MDLPVRILAAPLREPVVFVDGLAEPGEAAVLELSHWPGNHTPVQFRHDLSSGAALRFAQLDEARRAELTRGASAVANDHFDTDGCLALFVLSQPELALARRGAILDAAAAGDFFQWPTDRALAIDAIVSGLSHAPGSPLGAGPEGEDDLARWNRALSFLLEHFPTLLDGDLTGFEPIFEPVLERAREDRSCLADARREEVASADLTLWHFAKGAVTRPGLPGRHALFGTTSSDRSLLLAETGDGTLARLVVSTRSWFDLESPAPLPRPDLEAMARTLNELEGTEQQEELAWRAQSSDGASPELWFGTAELDAFAEHNDALAPSRLSPDQVRAVLTR
ncbi:MAG TPA: hypothetical protein ENJ09_02990 [Planctomycetes bacterium]|nr:hypothetical protein [Planctomycetota bacterium]